MAAYHFYLRNGDSPDRATAIHLHIRWGGHRLVYPTGCKVIPRHWNAAKEQATSKAPTCALCFPPVLDLMRADGGLAAAKRHDHINDRLKVLLGRAVEIMARYANEHGRTPQPNELRDALYAADGNPQGDAPPDLFGYITTFINSAEGQFNTERKRAFHRATISRFAVALRHLQAYTAHRRKRSTAGRLEFAEVDPGFVAGFAAYLTKEGGYSANTVVKYGKTLREFLRRAEGEGHPVNPQVFARRLALREEPSEQVYLSPEELTAVYRMDLSRTPSLERVRDLFIVGAWTGLRFGDLSRLQPEHVEGDRIRIPTAKTGKEVWIPLHPFVREIMAKYGGKVPPAISNQKANEYLKELLALVPELQAKVMVGRTVGGIRREAARPKWQLVTTHTARRSFATNCYRSGIQAKSIMAVTGHTTEQAFQRYIRLTNEEHADIMAASPLFTTPHMKAV